MSSTTPTERLRQLLAAPGMLRAPGVHDGFSARAAELVGFDAIYVGGGTAVAIDFALPDMGLLTMDEIVDFAGRIASVVDIPVIADLDDAGGNPLRIRRVVQSAERAGIAALQIEDADFRKAKHVPARQGDPPPSGERDKALPIDEAVQRIRTAVEARRDPRTVVIARTDVARHSVEDALDRGRRFAEAGADLVFLAFLPLSETRHAVEQLPVPLMNCIVRYEGATREERDRLERDGLKLLFDAGTVPLAAYGAAWNALTELRDHGGVSADYSAIVQHVGQAIRQSEWTDLAWRYDAVE
jgi:2-methylisocitrate lyase-like PEP mutase family enzyme